uniref:Polyprotein n=1 Tax=Oryza sativa subsp. japonica TaxID=39947 RepID=Q5W6P3_ORYSJ|nr:putative polyprotein [Oryza sativa Japonica Group]
MDRQWMYADRRSKEFIDGVHYFLRVAEANRQRGFICCPCNKCKNQKEYSASRTIHFHLFESGFMPSYNCWTSHGEQGVEMEEDEVEDDNIPDFAQYVGFEGNQTGEEEIAADGNDVADDLGQMLQDAREDCESEKEAHKLDKMLEDHRTSLYPGCEQGHKKLDTTLELLQWKAKNGVSDKAFGDLLKLIKNILPGENKLPETTYEAKKIVCPLGLEVHKIHACPNDCILYRGEEYENLEACPVCKALRYKIRRDDPGEVDGQLTKKRIPAKRKYIMMPIIIQGPKQPGNDIDVYLRPLVEDLKQLWKKEGVPVWDEDKQEEFNLRALLFVTINDWPALSNLSGQSNKGYKACTHCMDETESTYLKHCRKVVYMGHRRFLAANHPVRKKGKHFEHKADHRTKPKHRSGKTVFAMVKDLKVVFGKGPGSQHIESEDGHAAMWKKNSIFWELPYWEFLDVRHAIDVMHLTKNLCVNLLGFLGVYGKSKDTLEARNDLKHMEQRGDLHPEPKEKGSHYLSPASYTLSKAEKESMFECLESIKVPSGYSTNIKRIISTKEKKFTNLKQRCSCRCHGTRWNNCHVPLFRCQWVRLTGGGVMIDDSGMTTVDLNKVGYSDEPFVLANDVTQVFFVKDMSSKGKKGRGPDEPKRQVVLPGKRKIVGVEDKTDEDYDQLDGQPPFTVTIDPSILLSNEDTPYSRSDHKEGTIGKSPRRRPPYLSVVSSSSSSPPPPSPPLPPHLWGESRRRQISLHASRSLQSRSLSVAPPATRGRATTTTRHAAAFDAAQRRRRMPTPCRRRRRHAAAAFAAARAMPPPPRHATPRHRRHATPPPPRPHNATPPPPSPRRRANRRPDAATPPLTNENENDRTNESENEHVNVRCRDNVNENENDRTNESENENDRTKTSENEGTNVNENKRTNVNENERTNVNELGNVNERTNEDER